jgi:hypothetical protein
MGTKFKDGDHVILPADAEEGWEEELATVIGEEENGTLMVEVDVRLSCTDDGLREVAVEGVRLA